MCGFAGFVGSFDGGGERAHESLRRMGVEIAHRGPDGEGIEWVKDVSLGLVHRRLSVIDLSDHGNQPMWSSCGRFVIVYNGEVYNFRSLADDLEKQGCSFRGHSDTEVVLAAISQWGLESALQRFVGMFAFALWDREERELSLVRDRLGIKPLYYTVQNGLCFFGSELRPMRHLPGVELEIDSDSVADFLNLGYIPAPASIYRHVQKLPPGHLIRISVSGGRAVPTTPQPYWTLQRAIDGNACSQQPNEEEALEALRTHLSEATRIRMIADVPLGAFLSGGIDSTLVTAFMQQHSSRPIRTFSIGINDYNYDEAKQAGEIARYLGTDHTERYLQESDITNLVVDMSDYFDEPFADVSQLPSLLLARITREEVTVALSGDGGDELFAGYNRHMEAAMLERVYKGIPTILRKGLARGVFGISAQGWDRIYSGAIKAFPNRREVIRPGEKLRKFARAIGAHSVNGAYGRIISHSDGQPPVNEGQCGSVGAWWRWPERSLAIAEEFAYQDTMGYLHDDVLTKVDRCTMAVGLEGRVPFLDHRLVEFAWTVPLDMKIRGGNGKHLLRKLLANIVPRELWDKPKMGFGVPIGPLLRGPLRDWADGLLSSDSILRSGILDQPSIQALWKRHLTGNSENSHLLWHILMFQAWFERNGPVP